MAHPNHGAEATNKKKASLLERLIFGNRKLLLGLFALFTLLMGYQASHLRLEASFEKMIPTYHPYLQNYLKNKADLSGLGNVVRISVENTAGDIFDPGYLDTLQKVTDEVFFIPAKISELSGTDNPPVVKCDQ